MKGSVAGWAATPSQSQVGVNAWCVRSVEPDVNPRIALIRLCSKARLWPCAAVSLLLLVERMSVAFRNKANVATRRRSAYGRIILCGEQPEQIVAWSYERTSNVLQDSLTLSD